MKNNLMDHLDFEKPIVDLETKISQLRAITDSNDKLDVEKEMDRLQKECDKMKESVYANLNAWQIAQLARHRSRPRTLDYIGKLFSNFEELHGDRQFADDASVVAGIGRFNDMPVAIVGQQKGRDTEENIRRNFGMSMPEGYRKARRIFKLAERFSLPVLTFIDTPGAYPGVAAEERGQSEAIAANLQQMAELRTPIISMVIGEGGSGGALAIGVADRVLMMQYAIYSVISPEGCASILWKDAAMCEQAAETMGITAQHIMKLGLIDAIVPEPLGGAHRDLSKACAALGEQLATHLKKLNGIELDYLLQLRYEKLLGVGVFDEL